MSERPPVRVTRFGAGVARRARGPLRGGRDRACACSWRRGAARPPPARCPSSACTTASGRTSRSRRCARRRRARSRARGGRPRRRSAAEARSTRARRSSPSWRRRPGRSRGSSRCRRPTRAPSGRRTSGCCSGRAGRAAGCDDARDARSPRSTTPSSRSTCRSTRPSGTAMNALAHCAEAYYHPDAQRRARRHADTGATAIGHALPLVAREPRGIYGAHAAARGRDARRARARRLGLCLAHAMAQALGGRYGLPQGAMNALCLPGGAPLQRRGRARGGRALRRRRSATDDARDARRGARPARRLRAAPRLRRPGGRARRGRRRDRRAAGAKANPRPASAEEVAGAAALDLVAGTPLTGAAGPTDDPSMAEYALVTAMVADHRARDRHDPRRAAREAPPDDRREGADAGLGRPPAARRSRRRRHAPSWRAAPYGRAAAPLPLRRGLDPRTKDPKSCVLREGRAERDDARTSRPRSGSDRGLLTRARRA